MKTSVKVAMMIGLIIGLPIAIAIIYFVLFPRKPVKSTASIISSENWAGPSRDLAPNTSSPNLLKENEIPVIPPDTVLDQLSPWQRLYKDERFYPEQCGWSKIEDDQLMFLRMDLSSYASIPPQKLKDLEFKSLQARITDRPDVKYANPISGKFEELGRTSFDSLRDFGLGLPTPATRPQNKNITQPRMVELFGRPNRTFTADSGETLCFWGPLGYGFSSKGDFSGIKSIMSWWVIASNVKTGKPLTLDEQKRVGLMLYWETSFYNIATDKLLNVAKLGSAIKFAGFQCIEDYQVNRSSDKDAAELVNSFVVEE